MKLFKIFFKKNKLLRLALLVGFLVSFNIDTYAQAPPAPSVDAAGQRLSFTSQQHLKDYIDYYDAEYTDASFTPVILELEELGFESLMNVTKRAEYFEQGIIELVNDDIEDDLYIGDNRFATLLNVDHEIIIDNVVYKYEPEGAFISPQSNQQEMYDFIENWRSGGKQALPLGTPSMNADGYFIYNLDTNVDFFQFDYRNTVSTSVTSNGGGISEGKSSTNFLNPYDLDSCEFDDDGFFEGILPGSSEKCIDRFESKKRIVTKFSNQNYLIYSIVYSKVKSQKKNCCWWYKSDYCEFLELGLSKVLVKFPVTFPNPPVYTLNYLVKNNSTGAIIDSNGNSQGFPYEPEDFFNDWPFGANDVDFQIFFFTQDNDDFNGYIEDAIAGLLESLGKTFDELFTDDDTVVGMAINTDSGVYFSSYGEKIRRYGVKKIQKVYDQNFLISYTGNGNNFPSGTNPFGAKTYEVLALDIYGVGKYNGNYYGRRITSEGEVTANSTLPDSDGDGVVDIFDQCPNQYGESNYEGCPFSIRLEGQVYTPTRKNGPFGTSNKNFGSCFALDMKSKDVPYTQSVYQPDRFKDMTIKSGESILIKGETNILISTVYSNESVLLGIDNNICDITGGLAPQVYNPPTSLTKNSENSDDENNILQGVSLKSLTVSPNPAVSEVNVSSDSEMIEWYLTNQLGTLRIQNDGFIQKDLQLDMSHLPTGVYFLRVTFSDGETLFKTVIKE